MKKSICLVLATALICSIFTGCGKDNSSKGEVYVYNWGEYIDPEVITMFEAETGIKVIYDEYETNEIMYPKVESGASAYDCICPSDYMISKMIDNDMLQEINFDNIPNYKYIDSSYIEQSKEFDPTNKYSIPYTWGTVGILYNPDKVDDVVDSWEILWNEKYSGDILMQDSVRDAFMVSQKLLGYSMNTTDEAELAAARDLLIKQKPLVQAYVVDQARDKMIGEEAAMAVMYSGEYLYCKDENDKLEFAIPKEGTNVWIDSWVIPKNAPNKENAEAFIDFLCRPDVAKMNFDYITYATPNTGALELIDEDIRNDKALFTDITTINNAETYIYIGEDGDELYNEMWKEVKSN